MVKIVFDDTLVDLSAVTPLTLTEAAAKRLMVIFDKNNTKDGYLRIVVKGGGCNGFTYKFELTKTAEADDHVATAPDYPEARVLIDPESMRLLDGSELDFVETLEASQFVVKNPNATSSCGCGSSFGI